MYRGEETFKWKKKLKEGKRKKQREKLTLIQTKGRYNGNNKMRDGKGKDGETNLYRKKSKILVEEQN